ncbi:hypothetical protein [Pyxidicoccus caerfyrddinensis]|uniref:hypothetical protein n=1 Tax=Pyxidicoccus caerfyrddinensis TaxID=2709663 RepID=UPI0013DAAA78|nr:hypothetical protein [Pyxidicoccus caerfyrddinensis]
MGVNARGVQEGQTRQDPNAIGRYTVTVTIGKREADGRFRVIYPSGAVKRQSAATIASRFPVVVVTRRAILEREPTAEALETEVQRLRAWQIEAIALLSTAVTYVPQNKPTLRKRIADCIASAAKEPTP